MEPLFKSKLNLSLLLQSIQTGVVKVAPKITSELSV